VSFPIDAVRARFPSLAVRDDGVPRAYLDNPAGTQVPGSVAEAASATLLYANANLGGAFRTSVAAGAIVQRAHEAAATFLGAASYREVAIAQSMTNLTFAMSRSIGRTLERGDEIVLTRMDHDANVAPWLMLAEDLGLIVRWVPFDTRTWRVEVSALSSQLTSRTRVVALSYASNLTGSINDVPALVGAAKRSGALVFVDAVQLAPHALVDVRALGCDFLACSSYKFFGPHLGIVWGRQELLERLPAYKVRPATEDLPWKFETGTPQVELLAALTAAVEYFAWLGAEAGERGDVRARIARAYQAASAWERDLAARLIDGLQRIGGIEIYGIVEPARYAWRVPTVSFRHGRVRPDDVARALGAANVFAWSGNNYALEVVRQLGIPEEEGVVRIGIAHYNTPAEIDRALDAIAAL